MPNAIAPSAIAASTRKSEEGKKRTRARAGPPPSPALLPGSIPRSPAFAFAGAAGVPAETGLFAEAGVPAETGLFAEAGAFAEAAVPEGAVPEGAVPEGAVPEGAVPEGAVPEGAVPEGAAIAGWVGKWAPFNES